MIGYKDEISKENYIENSLIEKSIKLVSMTNKMDGSEDQIFDCFDIINPLTSPGEGVTVFTSPYLSAGAPALSEAKGLIIFFL